MDAHQDVAVAGERASVTVIHLQAPMPQQAHSSPLFHHVACTSCNLSSFGGRQARHFQSLGQSLLGIKMEEFKRGLEEDMPVCVLPSV